MTHRGETGKAGAVNGDAVLRARVALLGSGGLSLLQEVEAYRVLAPVSPDAYAPKLARWLGAALQQMGATPERWEELTAEAVAAARLVRPDHARREETLYRALDGYRYALETRGRRAEALAVREELAALGTPVGAPDPFPGGDGRPSPLDADGWRPPLDGGAGHPPLGTGGEHPPIAGAGERPPLVGAGKRPPIVTRT
ncbi:hypothetical protein AB0E83_25585 [Streptomyces sp. NPDC035033]|uniref:hypothetical protein n=1 Tax=Streptomyces sp. NPDC035033 TaxID=3155368 RepID=UPI0033D1530A